MKRKHSARDRNLTRRLSSEEVLLWRSTVTRLAKAAAKREAAAESGTIPAEMCADWRRLLDGR